MQKTSWGAGTQSLTHHNILREGVPAEGAVIKHDLIEGLRRHGDNPAAVVPGVPMLRSHSRQQVQHRLCEPFMSW